MGKSNLKKRLKSIDRALKSLMEETSKISEEIESKKVEKRENKYEEFKTTIEKTLRTDGPLTWTEIKRKAGLKQRVPNNKWVRMLEADIGLRREWNRDRGTIWSLR